MKSKEVLPKILVIVGPTASGKSALAIRLAKKLDGEIVSADSRQVYVGLDIGSGKMTKREMAGIPHHMLDVANPKRIYSVMQYQRQVYKVIDDILLREKLPILVGGTGHYIDAITKGLVIPEVPPNSKLRKSLANLTSTKLYKQLKFLDPKRAKQIDKHNTRRLVRAIEIATALGKVPKLISRPKYSPTIIGMKIENGKLRINICERLLKRLRMGMVREVRRLHGQGVSWKRMFDLGLEYRYVSLYLQKKLTRKEMLEQLEAAIYKYAKRQMTWFKANKEITWLPERQVHTELLKTLPLLHK